MATPQPRRVPYTRVDVFTSVPLRGNALAVFPDATGLDDGQLQAIARELRLSETAFAFPDPAAPAAAAVRVRIFTVQEELPYAGHPALGAAVVLRGARGGDQLTLALRGGAVPVTFEDRPDGTFCEMRQRDPVFGERHEPALVSRAAGVNASDLDDRWPIQTVSTGLPFAIVPIRLLATLRAMRPDPARMAAYLSKTDARFFYFVTTETWPPEIRLRARMIFYGGEDPATGSAAGCAAAWMVRYGLAEPGERVVIEQGVEVNRPSQLHVVAGGTAEKVTQVRVGGHVVEAGRGELVVA